MIINDRVEKIDGKVIERYREVEPATIGHFKSFGFMSSSLKPALEDTHVVGPALTIRIPSMDSTLCHKALGIVQEGDVLVIDRCGDTEHACWGGVTTLAADVKGAAGAIVDGAVTDIGEIRERGFPAYYKSTSALTTKLMGVDGEINTTVNCGGVSVDPGDLIVGDENGIVVIKPENAESILEEALKKQKQESGDLVGKLKRGKSLPELTGVNDMIKSDT